MVAEFLIRWEANQRDRNTFWEHVRADQKAEFINGEEIFHSPVLSCHAFASEELSYSIGHFNREHKLGCLVIAKVMCRFETNDYKPDLAFYLDQKLALIKPDALIHPNLDFIIEILSPLPRPTTGV